MDKLRITAGSFVFDARFETALAPKTCAIFKKLLPYQEKVIHVRWSGEGVWVPLGDLDLGLTYENHTSYPAPRPDGRLSRRHPAKPRFCWPMARCIFSSKLGQLAGSHFITLTSGLDRLYEFGRSVLYECKWVMENRFLGIY